MNYSTEKLNGKTIYNIENKKYIESEEATNYIKIDVNNYGIMIAELYPKVAPITVENIKELIKEKFYDGIIFHRVIKDFMIQTGDPTGTGIGGSEKEIKGEFEINGIKNNISHTRGVLSMARRGSNPETEDTMNSASSQFFIVHQDSNFLDGSYASFGKLLNGYDILDKIATTSTDQNDKPLNDIKMNSIRFVTLYEE
ncbi:MAG: peptidylprolyl isomerase [Bacilli bacterium]|nr:peptidylprolyl isomerase [Bacilli bacterium]